jgi:probable addiction module antidote protein
LGVLELTALSHLKKEVWLPALHKTDVLLVGGGDCQYLFGCMQQSGFAELMPELLEKIVYVGQNAGSMIMTSYGTTYGHYTFPAETAKCFDQKERFLMALKDIAKAHGVANVASESVVTRQALYRTLSEKGNPEFSTLLSILSALGLKIMVDQWCISSCVGFIENMVRLFKGRVQTYGHYDSGDSAYSRVTIASSIINGKVETILQPMKKARNPDQPEPWVRQVVSVTRSTDKKGEIFLVNRRKSIIGCLKNGIKQMSNGFKPYSVQPLKISNYLWLASPQLSGIIDAEVRKVCLTFRFD